MSNVLGNYIYDTTNNIATATVKGGQVDSLTSLPLGVTGGGEVFLKTGPVGGGGDAVTVADGADVAEGATTDAAVAASAAGTVSAKLRRLTTDIGVLALQPTRFTNAGANATLNVKSSAGSVLACMCINTNAASRYLQLHNTATVPADQGVPVYSFLVPAGGMVGIGTDFFTNAGTAFSTGIAFAFSTTANTYTAGTAADQTTTLHYK